MRPIPLILLHLYFSNSNATPIFAGFHLKCVSSNCMVSKYPEKIVTCKLEKTFQVLKEPKKICEGVVT